MLKLLFVFLRKAFFSFYMHPKHLNSQSFLAAVAAIVNIFVEKAILLEIYMQCEL